MSERLDCVEVEPPETPARASVVWLHGLGASGHDFPPIVPHLDVGNLRFVFPHAPQRPVTINGGMVMPSWYDITSLGPGGTSEADVATTTEAVEKLMAREEERFGSENVVLAGFSQGGAIALHAGLRHASSLAGLLILSAYELFPERREGEAHAANRSTEILFCHGSRDPMVPHARGHEAFEGVRDAGWSAEWRDYPMGHEVCLPELQDIGKWLNERLPATS